MSSKEYLCEFSNVLRNLTRCARCILDNHQCHRSHGIRGPCQRCQKDGEFCLFFAPIHLFTDMGSQAPAIDQIAANFLKFRDQPDYDNSWVVSAGFGCLHGGKSCTRGPRRYTLTNGTDSWSETFTFAIFASPSAVGREIAPRCLALRYASPTGTATRAPMMLSVPSC
jgi:hypothetical protein